MAPEQIARQRRGRPSRHVRVRRRAVRAGDRDAIRSPVRTRRPRSRESCEAEPVAQSRPADRRPRERHVARDPRARDRHRCLRKPADERLSNGRRVSWRAMTRPAADGRRPRRPSRPDRRRWWWQFHQAATSAGYFALLLVRCPTCAARAADSLALAVFLTGFVAALTAITLRLHLWFTCRSLPSHWRGNTGERASGSALADLIFVLALATAAAMLLGTHPHVATLPAGLGGGRRFCLLPSSSQPRRARRLARRRRVTRRAPGVTACRPPRNARAWTPACVPSTRAPCSRSTGPRGSAARTARRG